MTSPALLALADGSLFRGVAIGAEGQTVGEVVFNTAMSGYQEILTDPSYSRQIVTLTYPHIGNTGCNAADAESAQVHAAGLVIRDLPLAASNWRIRGSARRLPSPQRHRRHRRDRHAPPDAHPARQGRAERLPGRRREHFRRGRASPPRRHFRASKAWTSQRSSRSRSATAGAKAATIWTRPHSCTPRLRFRVVALRLRHQAQHPAHARRSRLRRDRRAGRDAGERGDRAASRRRAPRERPGRSGALRLRDRRDPRVAPRESADVRHLPRPSAARPCGRRQDDQDEVRPSRREPSGHRSRRPAA